VIQLRASDPFKSLPQGSEALPLVNACEVLKDAPYPTISLGHRRVGIIKGPRSSPLTLDRVAGYEDALRHAGIAIDPNLICHGDFTLNAGYEGAGIMLGLADRPSAGQIAVKY